MNKELKGQRKFNFAKDTLLCCNDYINKTCSALRNSLLAYKYFSYCLCFTSMSYWHFSRILSEIIPANICSERVGIYKIS